MNTGTRLIHVQSLMREAGWTHEPTTQHYRTNVSGSSSQTPILMQCRRAHASPPWTSESTAKLRNGLRVFFCQRRREWRPHLLRPPVACVLVPPGNCVAGRVAAPVPHDRRQRIRFRPNTPISLPPPRPRRFRSLLHLGPSPSRPLARAHSLNIASLAAAAHSTRPLGGPDRAGRARSRRGGYYSWRRARRIVA
jgi:hypothetical protein